MVLDDGWGIGILQEVRRRKLKTRVSIMTAYPSTETAQDGFRLHAFDYLINPLRHGDLYLFRIEICISVGAAFQSRPALPSRLESRSHRVPLDKRGVRNDTIQP
jgi:DNA-binding NtrC family response regulator